VDLSRWQGAVPTRDVLDEMTDAILLAIRDLLAGLRHETPPPELFQRADPTLPERADDVASGPAADGDVR
jgi:hypothetical protein